MFAILLAVATLSMEQPRSTIRVAPPPPIALTEAERRYPVGPPASDWPAVRAGRPLVAPDWSDHNIYPAAALRLEQEGRVRIALRVGADGQPGACRIVESSGHVELDDGSCDLGMAMRFPQASAGETLYSFRINWALTDPIAFEPARAVAQLDLADGRVTACRLEPGNVPAGWTRDLCGIFTAQPGYFLGASLARARHAAIVVELRPAGHAAPVAVPPPGRLAAESRTEFELAEAGDFTHCRTAIAQGFGTARNPYWGACGPALVSLWIEPPADTGAAHGGTVEIKVYVDR